MKKLLSVILIGLVVLPFTILRAMNITDTCDCGYAAQWEQVAGLNIGGPSVIPVALLPSFGVTEADCIRVGGILAIKNGCDDMWYYDSSPTLNGNYYIPCDGAPLKGAPGIGDGDDGGDASPPPDSSSPLIPLTPFPLDDPCHGSQSTSSATSDGDLSDDEADGMPIWYVSEPYISLWLHDRPLGYTPARGPRISLSVKFNQRAHVAGYNSSFFSLGKKWNFSWSSYITEDAYVNQVVHLSSGAKRIYTGTNVDYLSNTRLTGNHAIGFTLSYPDGRQDVYGFIVTNSSGTFLEAFLTERINPQGKMTTLNYYNYSPSAPVVRLQSVVDGDGQTNLISYTNNTYSTNLISQVTDPFGRSANFYYDGSGHLIGISDVAQNSTSLMYDNNDVVTNMTTPYGSTTFLLSDPGVATLDPNGRSVRVIHPDGGVDLFLYTNSAPGIASSYSSTAIPNTAPFSNTFDTNNLDVRNTFHWGPRQYASLHTTNIASFNSNDYLLAGMQHWLGTSYSPVGKTISMKRAPSPSATSASEGQKTWFDYAGKTNSQYEGTQFLASITARVLPDGSTSYEYNNRNILGNTSSVVSTYSAGSSVALRTNIFVYDATAGVDLLIQTNAIGVQVLSNSFNAYHQILTKFDALNQITTYGYNADRQLISVTLPSGLIITNIYSSDGHLASNYSYAVVSGSVTNFGTNIYTYSNDLVLTHTDARGLTTISTWDRLQRLVRLDFPDGTFVTNTYSKLDLVQTVDRMGFTNSFGYDSMRRKTSETNALGNSTIYSYCSCGALDFIQDALTNKIHFYYDNAGDPTNVVYADGYSFTNFYDLLGELTNAIDSGGTSVTNWFNNQGLKYAVSNYFGQVSKITFDALDRSTNIVDANGVVISKSYDNLNRVLTNSYPDGGTERYGYSFYGIIAYTNQLTNATYYGYDPTGRKIAETNANMETLQFSYNSAGDLISLLDGKLQSTTWKYDVYGSMTNKNDANGTVILTNGYDANHRLTTRWTVAKGNTIYSYDSVGNLTNITYPTCPAISLAYDAMNRMTNMIDAIGTNKYTYDQVGQILTEDGPWTNDTVTFTYTNRLRSSLQLDQPGSITWNQTYAYDLARRMTNVISPAGSFAYSYDTINQLQVAKLLLPNTAYITNTYDTSSRMLSTKLKNSGNANLDAYTYVYNQGNQRTSVNRTSGDFVNYTYDNIGQLQTALAQEMTGGTNRLNEQFRYAYDAAHNLQTRTNNTLVQTFNVNSLNELTNIIRNSSNTLTVVGTTGVPATNVTVTDGTVNRTAILYNDATFAATNFSPVDGSNIYTATAGDSFGRLSTNAVTNYLPASANYSYDANGNLTSDGTRNFAYDDENQLTNVWVTNAWMSQFVYDGRMRRRITREFTWQSSTWVQTNETKYIYDMNLAIQERDTNNLPTLTYTRGLDLAGTLQTAGGIGSLLALSKPLGNSPEHFYYHADGGGNITAIINGLQFLAAKYLYDPYGNVLSQSGPMAAANMYRFSSKESHVKSGLVYYLYRFYDPNLQRWINRDPIREHGRFNLYGYVGNSPINRYDAFGLKWYEFWNWFKPTLTKEEIDERNAANVGTSWMDPNLSDENSFDKTFLGSFSLFNLVNGNIGEYAKTAGETAVVKGPILLIGKRYCPVAAGVASKALGILGLALTVGTTGYDAANAAMNNWINSSIDSSPPVGPNETYLGDGVFFDDPYKGLY